MGRFRELPQAFLKKYNINAEFVPVRSTVNLFLLGGVDAQVVMDYNELNSIIFQVLMKTILHFQNC